MKPIIGVTLSSTPDPQGRPEMLRHSITRGYADCIAAAGGTPILIPPQAEPKRVLEFIDGWLIPGGDDLPGSLFGQETHPAASLEDPARIALEQAMFRLARPEMPILGICYGCQLINVLKGGALHQHLPDVLGHGEHSGGTMQSYEIEDGLTARSLGQRQVNGKSYHHQGVSQPAPGMKIVGRAADGAVEAIEDESGRWLLGVQWHPERTPDDSHCQNLFSAFVAEAARRK
jgi:gamma-glutamyl-gamma-aminobutyrate hydrolase PuuD